MLEKDNDKCTIEQLTNSAMFICFKTALLLAGTLSWGVHYIFMIKRRNFRFSLYVSLNLGFHDDVFIHKFILLEVAYNESKDRIQYLLFNVWKTRYLRNRLQYLRKPWVNVFFFRYLHKPITPSLVIFLINNIWPDFGELLATPLKTIHKFHLIDWNVWFEIFKIYTVKS